MGRYLIVAILTSSLLAQTPAPKGSYFPPNTLDDSADASHFAEEWYSEQLRALGEPSLWESSKNQKLESYRFLWLRTFHHPISVRMDVQPDGSSTLTTKMANGMGGYKPGKLVVNTTQKISAGETAAVLDRIEHSGFWTLAPYEHTGGEDGAQWIVEGVKDGAYHVVDRWTPEKGPVREIGMMMLQDLAKMKIPANEIY